MSWRNHLLDASFKGISLEVLDEELSGVHALSKHGYPYVSGEDVEDLGLDSQEVAINIIIYGEYYERQLQKLLVVLRERGAGELVHPVYGSMPNMQVISYKVSHIADERDACRVSVLLCENIPGAPFFDRDLSLGFADQLSNAIEDLFNNGFDNFNDYLETIRSNQSLINNVAFVISNAFKQASSLIDAVTADMHDLTNSPRTIISDINSVFSRMSDMKNWTQSSLVSDYKSLVKQTNDFMVMPAKVNNGEIQTGNNNNTLYSIPDAALAQTEIWFNLHGCGELAQNASDIFIDELDEPTLTPTEIENIVSDARTQIQKTIDKIRTVDSYNEPNETIDQLKDIAFTLLNQAEAVIAQKPPLITRTVEADSNLHLIAFRWYGDYLRADELYRLNPDIKHPSFITQGTTLNAYAK